MRLLVDGLGLNAAQRTDFLAARNAASHPRPNYGANEPPGLPVPSNPFIGRAQEIEAITGILADDHARLLTLTGPGGVGKTQIAIEAARLLADMYSHGTVFVNLSSVRKPEMVVPAIAEWLGVPGQRDRDIRDILVIALQGRSILMVLDNLEQVIDAAIDIAGLLNACPRLTILATIHVLLRGGAEHLLPIEPMTLPTADADSLDQSEAVSLFVARVRDDDYRFSLDRENAADLEAPVTRLQGMPLAIQLAATRVRYWPISELLQRMELQLPLLSGGARDVPDRHRAMRGTIAWSYDLLSPSEQAAFRILSVFPDGCLLDTAVAVLGCDRRFAEAEALSAVESLVESSFLQKREGSDGNE